jgi:chemotaxis protein MotB
MTKHSRAEIPLPMKPPCDVWKSTSDASNGLVVSEEDVLFRGWAPKSVHWSVPWSDLMMTMFILFTVMYIYQSANREALSGQETGLDRAPGVEVVQPVSGSRADPDDSTEPLKASMSKIYDLSKQAVRAEGLEDLAFVDLVSDKAVRIILTADLLFDTGRADLKPEAKDSLMRVAEVIRQTPYMVNVVGHTDSVSIHSDKFPTNWELSAVRACEVTRFLIEEMEIPGQRFYVTGHAYYQPVNPNNTAKNRARNRRVEIIITKEKPYGTQAKAGNIL